MRVSSLKPRSLAFFPMTGTAKTLAFFLGFLDSLVLFFAAEAAEAGLSLSWPSKSNLWLKEEKRPASLRLLLFSFSTEESQEKYSLEEDTQLGGLGLLLPFPTEVWPRMGPLVNSLQRNRKKEISSREQPTRNIGPN